MDPSPFAFFPTEPMVAKGPVGFQLVETARDRGLADRGYLIWLSILCTRSASTGTPTKSPGVFGRQVFELLVFDTHHQYTALGIRKGAHIPRQAPSASQYLLEIERQTLPDAAAQGKHADAGLQPFVPFYVLRHPFMLLGGVRVVSKGPVGVRGPFYFFCILRVFLKWRDPEIRTGDTMIFRHVPPSGAHRLKPLLCPPCRCGHPSDALSLAPCTRSHRRPVVVWLW
jgi:hypothetical protein